MMGYGADGWAWLWMLVPSLLVVSAIVFAFWAIARPAGSGGGGHEAGALTILKQRYIRGEIDRDEFERRRRDLDLS